MPQKIYYLTYNEAYSGVYQSQVIDVVKHLGQHHGVNVQLIALVPLKGFTRLRNEFKSKYPSIRVLPSFPKMKWWSKNAWIIRILLPKVDAIIGRNPLATSIAIELKKSSFCKKVAVDMRGAFAAEFKEFLTQDEALIALAKQVEKIAILDSDIQLFVTQKLREHYAQSIGYSSKNHVVIPTTLDLSFQKALPSDTDISRRRITQNIPSNAILLAFSGGNADWQSFQLIDDFFVQHLSSNQQLHVLFLSKTDISNWKSKQQFGERIHQQFVKPNEVFGLLSICDFGLLLRDESITNQVASPTKCAEYLACGLPVIISPSIGDYSSVIAKNQLGLVYTKNTLTLEKVDMQRRLAMQQFAMEHYFKHSNHIQASYKKLVETLVQANV